ncbi:MAG TPA: RebB family R body protein [Allosphingosinicella sp.]|jgi:hypothetical protein
MSDQRDADAATAGPASGDKEAAAARTSLNDQIVDSVATTAALAAGSAPAASAAMLSLAATETIALGMYNAVARQQADATINAAAVAAMCARMLGTSPPAPAPGQQGLLGAAEAQAQAAIGILASLAPGAGDAGAARDALQRIAAAAAAAVAAAGKADAAGAAAAPRRRSAAKPAAAGAKT